MSVKESSIFGQLKYLINFCVRKLRDFLWFYFAETAKSDRKYGLKCRHLHFWQHLKINILYYKKRNLAENRAFLNTPPCDTKVANKSCDNVDLGGYHHQCCLVNQHL